MIIRVKARLDDDSPLRTLTAEIISVMRPLVALTGQSSGPLPTHLPPQQMRAIIHAPMRRKKRVVPSTGLVEAEEWCKESLSLPLARRCARPPRIVRRL